MTERIEQVKVSDIDASPVQPERRITKPALKLLAASVAEIGVIYPVLLRKKRSGSRYEVIDGHRRVASARAAGFATVPAIVRDDSPGESAALFGTLGSTGIRLSGADHFCAWAKASNRAAYLKALKTPTDILRMIAIFGEDRAAVIGSEGKLSPSVAGAIEKLHMWAKEVGLKNTRLTLRQCGEWVVKHRGAPGRIYALRLALSHGHATKKHIRDLLKVVSQDAPARDES